MGGQTSTQQVVKDRFSLPINKKNPNSYQKQQKNGRDNLFKISGNMALGANDSYPNDIKDIKDSLRLLKSKQNQKPSNSLHQPANNYNGSYASKATQRQNHTSKNYVVQEYQKYNYQQPKTSRNPPNTYKDAYDHLDQNYPLNDYVNKKRSMTRQQDKPPIAKKNIKPSPRPQKQYYDQPQYKPNYQQKPQLPANSYQDKNIKQLNRQNRVQIQEYDPSEFVQCSEGCGRKFNPQSISRHEAICRKVFQQKRKEFNAQDQRLVANEQKKLMKRGEQVQKKIQQKKANEKIPKWKAQSLQLRAGVKQAKQEDYAPSQEQQRILNEARSNGMVKCQFCGRSFNEKASQKHIPFCQSQHRNVGMRRR